MADFYSVKDDAAKLFIQLGTEIDLFFVLGTLLLLLDAYLYTGSSGHYSLLTFDWSTQHGFNVGAIVGFFFVFSFFMTIVTPLLLLSVEFMMLMPWGCGLAFPIVALLFVLKLHMPFLETIIILLATAPAWRKVAMFFGKGDADKWKRPPDHVSGRDLLDFAYRNDKPYLLDRLDKHYQEQAARRPDPWLPKLAAGFLVMIVINAVIGYSTRATVVWLLFKWAAGLNENLQNIIQIAAVIFAFVVFGLIADRFRSTLQPDWIFYPPLADIQEQQRRERERPFD